MAKKKTPSFVVELPLKTTAEDERWLSDRVECAKRLYNTILQEGFDIVKTMRSSDAWAQALAMPKKTVDEKKARFERFNEIRAEFGFVRKNFDASAIQHSHAAQFRHHRRLGAPEVQNLAQRAYEVLNDWIVGEGGKPRFKGKKRPLHSIEGKNNLANLSFDDEANVLKMQRGWAIPVLMPDLKKDEWLTSALQSRTKYCRVVWRWVAGKRRWYVQMVKEGLTPIKAKHLAQMAFKSKRGGLDFGPGAVAFVTTDGEADKITLCEDVVRLHEEIKALQRQMARQLRAANPDNYHSNGTVKKGRRVWVKSNRHIDNENKLKELLRIEAAMRKTAHGRTVNFLLTKSVNWKDDGVSIKWLQSLFGKTISTRAPGMFMSELQRKAERAGGSREVINVRKLKNSQYDHATDTFTKKPLSQRWHIFGDGRGRVQRDIYSAFLALYSEGDTYQPSVLETAWQALESRLEQAGWYVLSHPGATA